MEFGSLLDDDLFDTTKNSTKTSKQNQVYTAKICEKEWFLTETSQMLEEDSTIVKYKGDLNYFESNFEGSYVNHKQALEAATNTTVRRDCLEALARSCMKLERLDEAVAYAELMFEESCNAFQKANASNLLATVYHATERHQDELVHLQRFASQNEWNADVWLRLAICYANISETCIPRICGEDNAHSPKEVYHKQKVCPEIHRFDDHCSCLTCPCYKKRLKSAEEKLGPTTAKIFACAYRSRWLYESCQTGNRSFACRRYDMGPKKLSRFLSELVTEESFWSNAQKNMIDKHRDDVEDVDQASDKQVAFEYKWFTWIESPMNEVIS